MGDNLGVTILGVGELPVVQLPFNSHLPLPCSELPRSPSSPACALPAPGPQALSHCLASSSVSEASPASARFILTHALYFPLYFPRQPPFHLAWSPCATLGRGQGGRGVSIVAPLFIHSRCLSTQHLPGPLARSFLRSSRSALQAGATRACVSEG